MWESLEMRDQGYLTRSVWLGNQRVRTTKGGWKELTEGMFTYDGTAKAGVRQDYAGGVDGDKYYLKNGGFFNENTEFRTVFTRPEGNIKPDVDISILDGL